MRRKVDDFSVDGVFNEDTDIARRTDANLDRDLGRLSANTDAEARAWKKWISCMTINNL